MKKARDVEFFLFPLLYDDLAKLSSSRSVNQGCHLSPTPSPRCDYYQLNPLPITEISPKELLCALTKLQTLGS